MKAYRLPNGLLELRELDESTGEEVRLKNSPLFKRFEAGIEPPDLMRQEHYAKHWLIIVGEKEDGSLTFFAEEFGDMYQIAQAAVSWKDCLLIQRFHMTDDDKELLSYLRDPRTTDGLCTYGGGDEEDDDGFPMWWHEPSYWPEFRDRDNYAAIIIVPTEIKMNVRAGHQRIRALFDSDKAGWRQECPIFTHVVKQKGALQEILVHPVIRAAIWVTAQMERDARAVVEDGRRTIDCWYSNPKK